MLARTLWRQLQVETVPSLDDLVSIRVEWQRLWQRCRDATIFQSPAWLMPWARHFAPDRSAAITVREHGKLVALVPLFTWNETLLLAGTGPTDYCDGLFAPDFSLTAETVLVDIGALAVRLGCSCIDLQQLRPASPLLRAPAPAGWINAVRSGTTCLVAQLAGEHGLCGLSHERRKKLTRAQRKLQAYKGYELGPPSKEESGEMLARTLEQLHSRRWESRGEPGVLADPLMRAFTRAVLPELRAADLLRVQRLKIATQTVAIVFAACSHRTFHFYLGGFNPEWSRFSPGTVTVVAAMKAAAAEGASEFHFLRGCEDYKYHLGARDRPTFRRVLTWKRAAFA